MTAVSLVIYQVVKQNYAFSWTFATVNY